ncbi:MAG: nitrate reductase [Planctomycetota bacterium]|nr:nitrate reductase [Planctomycetota bacterium]
MKANRREFIKASAVAAVAGAAGCAKPSGVLEAKNKPDRLVKSVCRFCGTGCGVMLGVKGGQLVALRGDNEHPTTRGLVCAKALFLPKIVNSPDRLKYPMVRKNGKLERTSWDEAMNLVCDKFAKVIKEKGPNATAYYGSGQAMTEESYLANRLFKGGIGTNNVEGNPRLCMASAVGGYVSTFGKDEPMGCYDDIRSARVFFLVGSNTAECHPVIFDQILAERASGRAIQVISIDPRKSPISTASDLYLQPKPGFDLAIFHAMAHVIVNEGLYDKKFMAKNVQFKAVKDGAPVGVDFEGYKAFLEDYSPEKAEKIAGVKAGDIRRAARSFAEGPTMSFWTMGLNQRVKGVWANNLMHNLHLITGQIGKPGMTPFSLTGQPNACGGVRDTGSLCHILPYGRLVKKPEHRAAMEKLWNSEPGKIQPKPGLHTIAMFEALGRDEIQAMFMLTTNPAHSLPNVNKHGDAIGKARPNKPFIVVLDSYPSRTVDMADVVLPAAMWSEKTGVFGMSERRYQIHPKVKEAPGEARSDFDILLDFAQGLEDRGVVKKGYIGGKFHTTDDVWDEIRLASKGTSYDFMGITRERLHKERGLRWPCPTENHPGTTRRFVKGDDPVLDINPTYKDDTLKPGETKFYCAKDQKAIVWLRPVVGPAEPADSEYPFVLSTGRVMEHWHTGTMTMKADELRRSYPECYVEMHPQDAAKMGIRTGNKVRIISRRGVSTIKARVVSHPLPGTVFVPWHWADEASLINKVTIDAIDPGSKQPEFKICAVKLEKVGGEA